ncbi:MAG TPA: RNA polymerase sigma factor [bacterium]|nr:RNA polymerase sigma factor [bacterium]HPP30216.1 RNA polymerase sigma factor [bacterium]
MDEKRLIKLAQQGNVEAFVDLLHYYEPRLKNTAFALYPDEMEDILQDTYLAAFKGVRKFRGNSSFYTWIYRIMLNIAYKKFRKQNRKKILFTRINKYSAPPPISETHNIQKEMVRNAVARLPLKYKEIITLYYFEGLSIEDIAVNLNINEGTVKSRLFNARKILKKFIEPYE